MNNIFYVYIHRRLTDNKPFYVGKGKGNRAFSLVNRNRYWVNTKEKHGFSVEIIFDNLSEDEAFACEKDTILELRYFGYPLTNMTDGGEGTSGVKQSAETIRKRVAKTTGQKRSESTRQLISESLTGIKRSDETKQKLSKASKGRKRNPDVIKKVAELNTGKTRSDETKALMSILAKERAISNNLSEKMKGLNNPSASKVVHTFLHVQSGEIFIGTRIELCETFNIKPSTLHNLFGNKRKIAAGWSLVKE